MGRVVVTGMAGISALGDSWETTQQRLRAGKNAVSRIAEWEAFEMLNTRLGAPIEDFEVPAYYPRKLVRSAGRVSLLAVRASEMALIEAGLLGEPSLQDGRAGVAYGSSLGSLEPIRIFGKMLETSSLQGVTSTAYIQFMAHTTAVNVALHFGLKGRIIPASSACTSGSQSIGYAYEAIRYGKQKLMLAGGAEEFSVAPAAVFDTLFATSCKNDCPQSSPRPFDKERDGLVTGEGAATLVLEDEAHAKARGAKIYAEVVGFATNSDGRHITQPEKTTMAVVMRQALEDAGLPPEAIGYVSAHGTATAQGDIAETQATAEVLGIGKPISSMKSYVGHTMGACGALEAWWAIEMMNRGWFAPTVNLEQVDPECGDLDYIVGGGREIQTEYVMSNNFAFGGMNTSLIFRRFR